MIITDNFLQQLIALQKIDTVLDGLDNEKKKLIQELEGAKKSLISSQSDLTAAKKDLETAQKTRAALELDSKTKLATISKHKEDIYQIKSNEAYAALQNEMAKLKQENIQIEENILIKMDEEEQAKKKIVAVQEEFKEADKKVKEEEAKYQQAFSLIDQKAVDVQSARTQAAGLIGKIYLDRYHRIRQSKNRLALAVIKDGVCQGCHMAIRGQIIIEVKKAKELVYCDSCGRILCVE